MTDEGAIRLGIAIISSACDDYITGYDSEKTFIKFCKSEMFSMITDCDPDYFICECRRMKHEKKKRKKRYHNSIKCV